MLLLSLPMPSRIPPELFQVLAELTPLKAVVSAVAVGRFPLATRSEKFEGGEVFFLQRKLGPEALILVIV